MGRHPKHKSEFRLGIKDGPSFGEVVRGARLGWRWSEKHRAFVRIHDTGMERAAIQLRPMGTLPSTGAKEMFVCWWEAPDLLDLIEELRPIRRVKRPIYFEVPFSREVEAQEPRP